MKTLLTRLQEPSTWAGLSALLALAGIQLPADKYQTIVHAVAAIAALGAMFLKEKSADGAVAPNP